MNTFKKMYWAIRGKGKGKEDAYSEVKKHFERITGKKPAPSKAKFTRQSSLADEIRRCF